MGKLYLEFPTSFHSYRTTNKIAHFLAQFAAHSIGLAVWGNNNNNNNLNKNKSCPLSRRGERSGWTGPS